MNTIINQQNNYEPMKAIDLGLSVKWADCNVGASSPEEFGDYYAWSETMPKSSYDDGNYRWYKDGVITKYGALDDYVDDVLTHNLTLAPEDDVAHVKLGSGWRMPTMHELRELFEKCEWEWKTVNGIGGHEVSSRIDGYSGRSIFLPAAGYMDLNGLCNVEHSGYIRSSTIYKFNPKFSIAQAFDTHIHMMYDIMGRSSGLSVRPVLPFNH